MPRNRHHWLYVTLGRRLKAARNAAGLTQDEAAEALEYAQSMISDCERGARRVDVFELREFADLYEANAEELSGPLTPEERQELNEQFGIGLDIRMDE